MSRRLQLRPVENSCSRAAVFERLALVLVSLFPQTLVSDNLARTEREQSQLPRLANLGFDRGQDLITFELADGISFGVPGSRLAVSVTAVTRYSSGFGTGLASRTERSRSLQACPQPYVPCTTDVRKWALAPRSSRRSRLR